MVLGGAGVVLRGKLIHGLSVQAPGAGSRDGEGGVGRAQTGSPCAGGVDGNQT